MFQRIPALSDTLETRSVAPRTVWTNVGTSSTTGIDDAIAMIDELEKSMGIATVRFELLAIAADCNRVLTERLDISSALMKGDRQGYPDGYLGTRRGSRRCLAGL